MTTIVKIIGAGVEMEIEDEIADPANDYSTLRRALSAVSPGMPKAKITPKKKGDVTTLEVQPKLDGKGISAADEYLQKCQETRNPAIGMYLLLNDRKLKLGSHDMYNLGIKAKAAGERGEEWIKKIEKAEDVLIDTPPADVSIVVPG